MTGVYHCKPTKQNLKALKERIKSQLLSLELVQLLKNFAKKDQNSKECELGKGCDLTWLEAFNFNGQACITLPFKYQLVKCQFNLSLNKSN